MKFEIEIKLRLPEKLDKIRRTLREQGFRVSKNRAHEYNVLFDTPKRLLRSHGKLIRVRRVGVHSLLTYKGPSEPGRYKKRREIEMNFPDAYALEQIFNEIGYHPIFRYEKFRTEFAKAPGSGKVLLDETPIGNFLEIEGSPRWIDQTAKLLGFSTANYITRSYGYLYLAYCRERRTRPSDMLFTAKDLRQLRKNNQHA
ncbi:MAG TPA: class IV adenylate cyclase [Bryobacteraceae bacterium]|nr:class IV adenylate cyclase [Bryobacteraceae bacterium]